MALQTLDSNFGGGGAGIPDILPAALRELQNLKTVVVAGAGAGVAIAIAGMLAGATIQSVTMFTGGVPSSPAADASTVGTAIGPFISSTGNIKLAAASTGNTLVVNFWNK